MKLQFSDTEIPAIDILQNVILRLNTGNISQKKSRERLIKEHQKLKYFYDKNNYIVHNVRSQPNLSLNLQHRVSIANLQIDHEFPEKFLLCRVITKFMKISALLALVEDPEGNVERLALYNWTRLPENKEEQMASRPIDQSFLPVGTKLVIKNLSYKVAADRNTIINSNNPEDIIIIDRNNDKLFGDLIWSSDLLDKKEIKVKTVDEFRRHGNDYFASKDYSAAIDEYSGGIELNPQNVTLLANRAEAYLRLFQFHNALNDTEVVLKYEPSHLKAAFRKGKALCGLKRYEEAIITLQDLHQSIKSSTNDSISSIKQSIEQLLKQAEILASENKNGQYDYISILDECCERAKIRKDSKGNDKWVHEVGARLDHADFLCEDIEIRLVEGKGRGWVAKRDIPENALLMVSKAFSIVYNHEVLGYSTKNNIQNDLYSEELIHRITQKLMEEPYHCQEVYKLYNSLNLDKIDMNPANVDIIGGIVSYNSFSLDGIIVGNSNLSGEGLWIMPSYFNHSCVDDNVTQYFLGDLMFIRSLRPILQGEELLLNYRRGAYDYENRSMFLKSVGIDCQCRVCKLDKSETPETAHKRAQLLNTVEKLLELVADEPEPDPSLIKKLEKTIFELHNLRKEHPELEFDTLEPSRSLSIAYRKNGNLRKAISILEEVYNSYKNVYLGIINWIVLDIVLYCVNLEQMEKARKWVDILLKRSAVPLLGKFKDEDKWKKEALYLTEKTVPYMDLVIKILYNNKNTKKNSEK
ncbi:unnamed protein product [Rhizophagus irregularis]|uniref:TPR-like protein n=1 Tax=Rhizophagus irregularis TaxID=588596 RepID=A0A2N1N0S3_9GLOM|nr:TPR-like protein [Rhizophagus irregularis]CAB4385578.1 unnamed protein product [Rhizophagus irregularis]CAB5363673.1 unnamed protein product [Rhizophagus irregularis]